MPDENTPEPNEPPIEELAWVPGEQNSYGLQILDCTSIALTMLPVTSNPRIAEFFTELRSSNGEQHRERLPEEPVEID